MTVVLDAFAFIAYLLDEPAAPIVQQLLWEERVSMTSVQSAEVIDRMHRVHGADPDEVEVALSALGVEVISVDRAIGSEAGRLRARHYGSTGRTLSMADAVCAAAVLDIGARLVTADPVLIDVVLAEGGVVLRLPSSAG